ncbi:MAG: TadE/TadG family type IV pilus assembly protein [Nocardioides sp.]
MMHGAMLRRRRSDDGAAAVEFALVAPLLIFLLFAIIGYGYMLSFRQGLSQGAAEGARAAAVAPAVLSDAEVLTSARNAINQALDSYGVSCVQTSLKRNTTTAGTCDITIAACAGDASKLCAKVALSYNYKDNSLLPSFPGLGIVLPSELAYTAVAEVS